MSLAETVYTARFRSTETIERGRTQLPDIPRRRDGYPDCRHVLAV